MIDLCPESLLLSGQRAANLDCGQIAVLQQAYLDASKSDKECPLKLLQSLHQAQLYNPFLKLTRLALERSPANAELLSELMQFYSALGLGHSALKVASRLSQIRALNKTEDAILLKHAAWFSLPSVSLYICCYNRAELLRRALITVQKQTLAPSELLVVDDGSTDGTGDVALSLGAQVIRHEVNRGVAAGRNSAIKQAHGELIANLDSDLEADPFWLECLVSSWLEQPSAALCGMLFEKLTLSVANRFRETAMSLHHGQKVRDDTHFFGSNGLLSRGFYEQLGLYNETYNRAYDDTDFSQRLKNDKSKIIYDPRALCFHLKDDTLRSVIETYYYYRAPNFERGTWFDSWPMLLKKLNACAMWELDRIHEEKDQLDKILVRLGIIFHQLAHDLTNFISKHYQQDVAMVQTWLTQACALTLNTLHNSAPQPSEAKTFLADLVISEFKLGFKSCGKNEQLDNLWPLVIQGKISKALDQQAEVEQDVLSILAPFFASLPSELGKLTLNWGELSEFCRRAALEDQVDLLKTSNRALFISNQSISSSVPKDILARMIQNNSIGKQEDVYYSVSSSDYSELKLKALEPTYVFLLPLNSEPNWIELEKFKCAVLAPRAIVQVIQ